MEFEKLKSYQQVLLSQVYSQKIQQNEEYIKTWMQYKDKHTKIVEGLQTLVHELTMNCMVPLGKRALMKGKLTHTNEILVCIGDGYFAKYSAQQAIELCNRRIKRSEEMLKKFEEERNLFEIRQMLPLDYGAFEFGDCKDVMEHWDDTKLEDWKVEHRKREQEYRQKLLRLKNTEKTEIVTEDDLFKRLDELELEEELADEFNRLEEEHQNFYGKNLQENEESEEDDESEEEDEEEDEEEKEEEEKELEQDQEAKTEHKDEKENAVNKEAASTISNEKLSHIVKTDQKEQENLLETVNSEKIKEVIPKSIEKKEAPVIKDTRINGKFEVSIIREDEVQKMLGRPNLSLDSCTTTYKSVTFEDRKKKRRARTFPFENSDCAESDMECRTSKGSGRRVSFADPHFEVKSSSDQEDDLEQEHIMYYKTTDSTNNHNDNIIQIGFKHSETQSLNLEGTKNEITSPQDIYRIFCKPKSILKRSLDKCYIYNHVTVADTLHEDSNETDNTESVVARSTYNMVVQDIQERKPEMTITESSEPITKKRPISRFRLERTNIKNKISK